jgi:hypothetical protein
MPQFCTNLSWACLDFWAIRYQTLLVGSIALSIAFLQMRIARNQHQIARRQIAMAEAQQLQAKAVALLSIDPVLFDLSRLNSQIIGSGHHWRSQPESKPPAMWTLNPEALRVVSRHPMEWNDQDIVVKAISVWPGRADDVRKLLAAARKLKEFSMEYTKEPWHHSDWMMPVGDMHGERDHALDATYNEFFDSVNRCGDLRSNAG